MVNKEKIGGGNLFMDERFRFERSRGLCQCLILLWQMRYLEVRNQ